MTADRPLLYLDIDGVIAIEHAPATAAGEWVPHQVHPWPLPGPMTVWIRGEWSQWAARLSERFSIYWATTWREEANRVMSLILGLPGDLPLLSFDQWNTSEGLVGKTACVAGHSASRPFVWIDDQAGDRDRVWLDGQPGVGEHLLIAPDPAVGLIPEDFERIMRWAEARR